ncbi:transporter substrate-binding domain-containing protein [Halobacteriovorax sp. GB3]|uniref:substrate-binding periplasmic protein n=1 Tax=Halobacteriovorax sp. GB3 TaxID=2719615 RepID=UPI00235F58DC|nr:transporter substrate-binding domain-containing protein [Halobacteriovorax sp. GB3]MDD0852040.1 transporter substrate-binding domain-containing protein [Halobacteriovorax sp. GB3]
MKMMFKLLCILPLLTNSFAAELKIFTEDSAPFQYKENDKIKGMASDIVVELMKRADVKYTHEMAPWSRAFNTAKENVNNCVYSTTETEERMPHFKWIGPLVSNDWVIMVRNDSDIKATDLSQIKGKPIGGYIGDALAEYLKSNGHTVDEAANDTQNAKKLSFGRIDIWATSSAVGPYLAKMNNITNLKELFTIKKTVMSIACHKDTDGATVKKLQDTLKKMIDDGTVEKIKSNYK